MESKRLLSRFQEVHKQVRERLDLVRAAREEQVGARKRQAEEEAVGRASTRPSPS